MISISTEITGSTALGPTIGVMKSVIISPEPMPLKPPSAAARKQTAGPATSTGQLRSAKAEKASSIPLPLVPARSPGLIAWGL